MKQVYTEKSQALVNELGWTRERAMGYVDGENYQRLGLVISTYHKIAMDEYAQGFRTGYYKQAYSIPQDDIEEATAAA